MLKNLSHSRIVLISIFFTICLGTILLALPYSQAKPVALIDCLFTAASSTCVTGALSVPFDSFTYFGKIIILVLIQIGGIGLATLTIFLASLFVNLGLATKLIIGQLLDLNKWINSKKMLFFVITTTLIIESLGALAIFLTIRHNYPLDQALFHSIFHSVSSFCSAGLSSFGHSMIDFSYNIRMLTITSFLIFFGTIGFIPLYELQAWFKSRLRNKRYNFSLTTRVIFFMTTILVIGATALLLIIESKTHFIGASYITKLGNMFFNALAYRSTGLTTIDIKTMRAATVFMILIYSFIGSSPGSTGSGIKVTTFALFLATVRSVAIGRSTVNLKERKIPKDQIFKVFSILTLGFSWIVIATFLLLLVENKASFALVFFEIVSAFTTLGLASELTPFLSILGKLIVILTMFLGRIGVLTLLLSIHVRSEREEFSYPEERIMIS